MILEKLLESLSNYKVYGNKDTIVSSITDDSRKVKKNSLFIAVKGIHLNGHDFIKDAINKGASAVIGDENYDKNFMGSVTYIKVSGSRNALGILASRWWDNPSEKLKIIGVTGTDGKTTTASLIYWILKKAGKKVGLISTISAKIGNKEYDTGFHVTNPEPLLLQELLSRMVKEGCEYAVLEVTSHGLDQDRVSGINFETAVLTNITHEHLDYHKTFYAYREAKAKLFEKALKLVVLNRDDNSYSYIKLKIPGNTKHLDYSLISENADLKASSIKLNNKKTDFNITVNNKIFSFVTNLLGDYNIQNILAAVSVAVFYEIPINKIQIAVRDFKPLIGRLEKININKDIEVYVDFAHTPKALENVLTLLKSKKQFGNKLIAVFGCAGERDVGKRSLMGEISANIADISVFTAEDPRSEDVNNIIKQMVDGAERTNAKEITLTNYKRLINQKNNAFIRIPLREEAIYFAINFLAKSNDIIVICGKGHERSMAYDGIEHKWSDHQIVLDSQKSKKGNNSVIFAAGKGVRMNSNIPKVLNKLAGKPIISYTLRSLREANFKKIIIVVGYSKEDVIKNIGPGVEYAYQENQLGTGKALEASLNKLPDSCKDVLAINGDDSAFYQKETFEKILKIHRNTKACITFASVFLDNPSGLGRIIRNKNGKIIGIVEERDATKKQKNIKEVNIGLYVFDMKWLKNNIHKIKKSPSGEYYVVDLIKIALENNYRVSTFDLEDKKEWFGINTQEELRNADLVMRRILS